MKLPSIPPPNSPIKHSWARELILYLKSQQLHSSATVRVSSAGSGGLSLEAIQKKSRRTSTESSVAPPWYPNIVSITDPSEALRIAPEAGQINNVTPTIGGDDIGQNIDGDPEAGFPYLTIASGTSGVLYCACTASAGGEITGITMGAGTSLPADTDEGEGGLFHVATHVYYTVPEDDEADPVVPEYVVCRQLWFNSLLLRRCGGVWIGA